METRKINYRAWPFDVKTDVQKLYETVRFGRPWVAVRAVNGHPFPVFDEILPEGASTIFRHDIYWSDSVYIRKDEWEEGEITKETQEEK